MSRREFHFSEGTSNKFWTIELDGKSHSVHFGRIGTDGQRQTKEFSSPEEAKKSYEKLIAEKVKKGYAEATTATKSADTPVAPPAPAAPKKKAEKPEAPASPPVPAATNVNRRIDLEPEDWLWATWRTRTPRSRPAPAPFNLQTCVERAASLSADDYGWYLRLDRVLCSPTLTHQEAHFWFTLMMECKGRSQMESAREVAANVAADPANYSGTISQDDVSSKIRDWHCVCAELPLVVMNLIGIAAFPPDKPTSLFEQEVLLTGFRRYVLPYVIHNEVDELKNRLRLVVTPANLPAGGSYDVCPAEFYLAALLGMHQEIASIVAAWPDDFFQKHSDDYLRPQRLVFGLGSAAQVENEMRRLKLRLRTPDHIRAWLACTEFGALEMVRESIATSESAHDYLAGDYQTISPKKQAERLAQEFARVKAPEAAPHMLKLKGSVKGSATAQQWLDEQVEHAIAGLIPVASRGQLGEAAFDYLREAKKKGHEAIIRAGLQGATADVAERVRTEVLDFVEKHAPVFDSARPSESLKAMIQQAKPGKLPPWTTSGALPPILLGGKRLTDEEGEALLAGLQRSSFEKVDPLVTAVKQHADAASLDAFAWQLFELWRHQGAPSKEKWAMAALGHLGGDASILKLTPLIRSWPGESQHQRAVFGLECLRAIGSDSALMQLNGVAQKLKFQGLKNKAREFMDAIAKDKGLTKSELEDRIVPDCDLDERGSRVFDFGSRKFRFVLGPGMKPMVKDAEDKVKPDLPKPGTKDDTKLAEQAVADWKLLKKQISEVAKIQAVRLEQAMVTGRRWPLKDFEALLVRHPLMINLVRLVVWGGYDKNGKLARTFRVTEDQSYADAKDEPCKLQGVDAVGIVHPLHLPEADRGAWGEVLGDYEIIPPFAQLGRQIYALETEENQQQDITRFNKIKLPAPTLVFGLEKLGWVRGRGLDGGGFDEHSKPFPSAEVTAVVNYEGAVGMGYIDANEQLTFQGCYFVPGQRDPSGYSPDKNKLALGDVDAVVISEVLTDLATLAAKGQ